MNTNKLPTNPELGDMVAFTNRVLQVWCGNQWYLLGGEKLPLVSYNKAIDYLLTGWGEPQHVFEHDLQSVVTLEADSYYREVFLKRCADANQLILSRS